MASRSFRVRTWHRSVEASAEPGLWTLGAITAGDPTVEHVVPPAGEAHAFDRPAWPLKVEVMVSPTGRSIRLHINGHAIDWKNL